MATKRQRTKQAPGQKKLRTAGFSNPDALKLDIRTPPVLRQCLGWGLFGSGIAGRRGHHEMSIAHSKHLIERYPSLYRLADASPVPSSPPFAREGFACGDGWFKLVDRLSAKLAADPNLVVGQIKEKLGALRIYFEPSPLPSDEIERATDAALAEAVAESRVTCEWCGRPGKHAQREGRWSIMCGACAAKDARRRLKELLSPWMRRLLALREETVFKRSKLLAASREQSRLDLSPEHALALLERYPILFREAWVEPKSPASPFACGGFEICDGWFSIVARLSAKLAKDTALHVVQVKEKYGRLKVYCDRDPSVPQDPRLDAELEAAIAKAADESERTCEVCGEPGTHEERHRWWNVRCGPCVQIDEMVAACERIAKRTEDLGLATFSANKDALAAVRLALVSIGHAAAGQPPASRARLPGIGWEKLEQFKEAKAVKGMPVDELWRFARRQAPRLGRKLR